MQPGVRSEIEALISTMDYPGVRSILSSLKRYCESGGWSCPSRATLYKFMQRHAGVTFDVAALPEAVQAALYNMTPPTRVSGGQLAFYCFNYGDLAAIHYAAALPWLPLYQAHRMRGWRPKSRGLLRAVLRTRGIPLG